MRDESRPHPASPIPLPTPHMIQRPQTVFLLLGAALLVAFAALTFTWLPGVARGLGLYAPLSMGAAALAAAVALVAVFLYKDRARQRTVIGAAQALALVALVPFLAGLFIGSAEPATAADGMLVMGPPVGAYLVAVMPLVAFVLLRMARRGVDRDIATIRSMDRLR